MRVVQLRARGAAQNHAGKQLMFADLYDHTWAAISYVLVTGGIAALCAGLSARTPVATAVGGGLLAATGVVVAGNLSVKPLRLLAGTRAATAVGPRRNGLGEPPVTQAPP